MDEAFLFFDPVQDVKLRYNTALFFLNLIRLYIEKIISNLALALRMVKNGSFWGLAILEEGCILVLAALARSALVEEKTHYYNRLK